MSVIDAEDTSQEQYSNFSITAATPLKMKVCVDSYLSGRIYWFETNPEPFGGAAIIITRRIVLVFEFVMHIPHKRIPNKFLDLPKS